VNAVRRPMLLDAFIANDEIAMLRYRLRAHRPLTSRTVIAESNVSIQREPKRLWVREALSDAELRHFNIRLVFVPFALSFSAELNRTVAEYVPPPRAHDGLRKQSVWRSNMAAHLLRSRAEEKEVNEGMRGALNLAVLEELTQAHLHHGHAANVTLVHLSDIDEILDAALPLEAPAAAAAAAPVNGSSPPNEGEGEGRRGRRERAQQLAQLMGGARCLLPRMRYHFYSEHCGARPGCTRARHPPLRRLIGLPFGIEAGASIMGGARGRLAKGGAPTKPLSAPPTAKAGRSLCTTCRHADPLAAVRRVPGQRAARSLGRAPLHLHARPRQE